MWLAIILLLYSILAIIIVLSLLLYGAKPSKTLAWLLVIFTIPVGGILLYLVLGRNRRKKKLFELKKDFQRLQYPSLNHRTPYDGVYQNLVKIVQRNTKLIPTSNNSLQLLKDGKTTFESIFETLESAQSQIHLQYYIFEDGELANRLLTLFEAKISKGVDVRMIYDGIGSFSLSKAYLKKLKAIGVEVYPFLPFKFGRFLASLNYRNHRKIIVVDNTVAFTGGINISDKYLKGDPELGNWHDMHLRIEGSAAADLNHVFAMDWYLVSTKAFELPTKSSYDFGNQSKCVQIVSGGPDDDFPSLEQSYLKIINGAKDYLYIVNPYIIPGQAILQALLIAALGGVDVRLLLSERSDSKIVNWSVRSYFETFLKAGIKIYLFPDGFLHSKMIVSDDAICTIGSANLDDRSFEHNYEVNAIVYDENFAKTLREDFLKDVNISRMPSLAEHQTRPWNLRLQEGIGRVLSPIL